MKKKLLSLLAVSAITLTLFTGCNNSSNNGDSGKQIKAGMVTDGGTVEDKSFNEGTWNGLKEAEKDLNAKVQYLQPAGTTEADYLKEIANLYDAGFKFIVTPGYKFETAVYKSQDKYADAQFVLIDGEPNDGNGNYKVGDNTLSIYFAEDEAGFLAGIAASVELKEGDLGFIGGMELPAVIRFNLGFQKGVAYANEHLGTNMSLKEENIVYEGTFENAAGGTQIAATMYDRGVKAIFCAAGSVGNGVITEAKTRVNTGETVWVIGVDSDQYNDGIYADGKSVVLTSAIKKVDVATYDAIKDFKEDKFKGGQTLTFDVSNDGVGIPEENPNLSESTIKTVEDIYAKIKDGSIEISVE